MHELLTAPVLILLTYAASGHNQPGMRLCFGRQQLLGRAQHRHHSFYGSLNRTRPNTVSVKANRSPCILITAPDGIHNDSLQALAAEVRQQLGVQTLVVAPEAATAAAAAAAGHLTGSTACHAGSSSSSSSAAWRGSNTATATSAAGTATALSVTAAASLTFQQELQLQPDSDHELTFSLSGATAADCVLCAVDQTCGLMQALQLSPVLVLVGVARSPALSSDMDQHPAVAVARQAALLGLPAVAACLATTSPRAPVQPAIAATVQLLAKLLPTLAHTSSSSSSSSRYQTQRQAELSSARNFPRAHFPFPEEGRWALGTQLPLPAQSAGHSSSSSSWKSCDCWALGDDNSWLGDCSSSSSSSRRKDVSNNNNNNDRGQEGARQRRYRTLQGAFAEGDLLVCLNVPPTWSEAAGFAATRPGVLWHCWQVESQGWQQQQYEQAGVSSSSSSCREGRAAGAATTGSRWSHLYSSSSSSSSNGSSSNGSIRSWHVDSQDLYGRTLPSTSYGSQVPMGSNFVGQDNTRKVLADNQAYSSWRGSSSSSSRGLQQQVDQGGRGGMHNIPSSFTVQRGTLLNDAAACGDVEAVFGGKASVTVCQTWPAGHPLSVRDELLLAALDEGQGGFPAWVQ